MPLVIGLVEVAKRAGLPSALAPLLAVGLGVLASVGWALSAAAAHQETLARALLVGVAIGLSASGLYSGVRAGREQERAER